jgi:chemotaxis protein methyltransferase CheR
MSSLAPLPRARLASLSQCFARRLALHFPQERWNDLERGLRRAAPAFGFDRAEAFADWLSANDWPPPLLEALASHFTVGETYFFREPATLDALAQRIIPSLDRPAGIRIWCAGCSSGEEAYSLAILFERLLSPAQWERLDIMASDINPLALARAREAVYGEWSFRGTPAWLKPAYFQARAGGAYVLSSRIRDKVRFFSLNLADPAYPAAAGVDVIFCRNVLMYFSPDTAARVCAGFRAVLNDGGWLAVSPAEAPNLAADGFQSVTQGEATLFRKGNAPPASVLPPSIVATGHETVAGPGAAPPPPAVAATGATADAEPDKAAGERARRCADLGQLAEAREWCLAAIAGDKLNGRHHYLLASVELEMNQFEAAAQSLRHALYLEPDFVMALFSLGRIELARGRAASARRQFGLARAVLAGLAPGDEVAESGGLAAAHLAEIIRVIQEGAFHEHSR